MPLVAGYSPENGKLQKTGVKRLPICRSFLYENKLS